ncbi:MAG: hypothetical protein WC101_04165 [Candidatus Gracilibacteria bacterium]
MNTKKHTSIRIILVTLLLVMGLSFTGVFSAGIAHAEDPAPATDTGNGGAGNGGAGNNLAAGQLGNTTIGDITKGDDIIVGLSKILAIGLRAISQLIWPLLMFGSGLLKSDFLYTGAIDIKLTEMWIQVRNLVNIIYVILLLAVALYNVLGLGETVDFLEIKKALPKIILGLLLVNFSYAGVKVVLDVVNVGTTFAFSLPRTDPELNLQTQAVIASASKNMCMNSDVEKIASKAEQSSGTKPADPKAKPGTAAPDSYQGQIDACNKLKGAAAQKACTSKLVASSKKGICIGDELGNKTLNPDVKKLLSDWNIDGALTIMAVKFMRMQDLSQIAEKLKDNVTISNLAINMLFSLVLYLVYGISFIVLIVVLFARAAVLWMVIVFSPLIVVNMTFPNLVSQLGGGAGDAAGKIIKTLIAPIIIGFVLSIGYILLSTMQNVNYDGIGSLISDVPTSNLDTFQDFMIAIGSVVFVWMGIEGAISGTIGESVSNMVMSAAKDAGGWLAKAPFYYTPLFQIKSPHGTHSETVSMGTLAKALDIAKSTPENHAHEEAVRIFGNKGGLSEIAKKEQLNEFMRGKDSAYFLENEENRNNLKKAIDKIKSTEGLKDSDPADHQLILLKKELDKGDKLNRVAADNALRQYKKTKGISDTAGAPGKAGAEGGGATSGTVSSSTDKEALKDGAKHLGADKKKKADALIDAKDAAAFDAANKNADTSAVAAQALGIHNAKDKLRNSDKVKAYAAAVKSGVDADIQKAADALKPEIEGFISSLGTEGGILSSDGTKHAEILGEVLRAAGDTAKAEKGKMATVTEAQIKRILKEKTDLGNNIAKNINK